MQNHWSQVYLVPGCTGPEASGRAMDVPWRCRIAIASHGATTDGHRTPPHARHSMKGRGQGEAPAGNPQRQGGQGSPVCNSYQSCAVGRSGGP